jgi:hypothetical protein
MRKCFWATTSFLLLLCCAPALWAQTPSPTTKAEKIRRILAQTDAHGAFRREMDVQVNLKRKEVSDIPQKFWDELLKELEADKFVEMLAPIYERHFTDQELTELIAFYETPLGKKMVSTFPQVVAESQAAGGRYGEEIAQKVIKRMQAEGTFPGPAAPPAPAVQKPPPPSKQ